MIKRADLQPFSIVLEKNGDIATYYEALASLSADIGPAPVSGFAIGWVNLRPVLLTDDWMMKAGFKQEGGSSVWWRDTYALWDGDFCSMNENGSYRTRRENVFYIHELQKAWFDVTGEELQIKAP